MEIDNEKVVAVRQVDNGEEMVECSLQAVFTCQKGINELSILPLPKIMQAKRKPLKVEDVCVNNRFSEIIDLEVLPNKRGGLILEGNPEEQVKRLVEIFKKQGILRE